jgi:prostaglandin-H2 D-isomerase / glutathione transferase
MKLELVYWNFPFWRAETSRIALFLGGIEFEDVRPNREEYQALKASGELPFGQLPILRVDGQAIGQTAGIARFCGKLSGLYPTDDLVAAARVDQVLDAATEITGQLGPSMRVKDPEEKLRLRVALAKSTLPRWLGYLESLLETNENGGYFVGASMTVADLAIWRMMGWLTGGILDGIPQDLMDGFPSLTRLYQLVDSNPKVREWMDAHYA